MHQVRMDGSEKPIPRFTKRDRNKLGFYREVPAGMTVDELTDRMTKALTRATANLAMKGKSPAEIEIRLAKKFEAVKKATELAADGRSVNEIYREVVKPAFGSLKSASQVGPNRRYHLKTRALTREATEDLAVWRAFPAPNVGWKSFLSKTYSM